MDDSPPLIDLTELCHLSGVTQRTVRYYVQQGLLPQPGPGREARKYGPEYLHRLKLIRQLQREHLPLAEIRQRLDGLSEAQIAARVATPAPPAASSALDYLDAVLGRRQPGTPLSPAPTPVAAASPSSTSSPRIAEPGAAPDYPESWPRERSQWERLALHDDVELHIRRPATRDMNRRIERLLEVARRILNDD